MAAIIAAAANTDGKRAIAGLAEIPARHFTPAIRTIVPRQQAWPDSDALPRLGLLAFWTALDDPVGRHKLPQTVANQLRQHDRAHITWCWCPGLGLGIQVGDKFADLTAEAMQLRTTFQGLLAQPTARTTFH